MFAGAESSAERGGVLAYSAASAVEVFIRSVSGFSRRVCV